MASIRKRKLATGAITWQVQIRRTGEQSITQTFQRKADAVAYISQTEHRLDRGATAKDLNKGRTPVAEVIDWYLGRFKRGKGQIKQLDWWRQHLGRFEIRKVTSGVLGDALHQLGKEKRSAATVNRYRAVMSHLLGKAVEGEYITARPAFPGRLSEPKGRVRYLTRDELAELLDACEPWPKLHALVTLAASTGARAGELLGLEWSDVHLDRGYALLRDTKNKTDRRMPLAGPSTAAIKAMHSLRTVHDPRVFHGFQYRQPWTKALDTSGLTDFRFHDLRHTAASHLAMNGATLLDIAAVLGHKTLSMVQRYAHFCDDHLDDVVARMNKELLQ